MNNVKCTFSKDRLELNIDLDTEAFDESPLVTAFAFAPSAFRYNRARFDKGQKIGFDLSRDGDSNSWNGTEAGTKKFYRVTAVLEYSK